MKSITELFLLKRTIKKNYGTNKKFQIREATEIKKNFVKLLRKNQDSYLYFYKYYSAMYAILIRPYAEYINKAIHHNVFYKDCEEAPLKVKIIARNRYNIKKKWLLNEKNTKLGIKFCEIHIFPKKNNYFCYLYNVINIFFFKKQFHHLKSMTNSGLKNFIQAKKRTSLPALEKGITYLISKMVNFYKEYYKNNKLFLLVKTINIANLNTIKFIKNIFLRYKINIHFFFIGYKKPYGYFRARKKRRI